MIGIAGSDTKCKWLVDEAGFDHAINYKTTPDLDAAISEAMPKGVDVLFDNVGNEMVNRVLPKMRLNGRICISGQVADYNLSPEETPGIVNTKPFITHRVLMQGLVVFDFAREFPVALNEMATLIGKGELKLKEERSAVDRELLDRQGLAETGDGQEVDPVDYVAGRPGQIR